jgi:hypothetical protein
MAQAYGTTQVEIYIETELKESGASAIYVSIRALYQACLTFVLLYSEPGGAAEAALSSSTQQQHSAVVAALSTHSKKHTHACLHTHTHIKNTHPYTDTQTNIYTQTKGER